MDRGVPAPGETMAGPWSPQPIAAAMKSFHALTAVQQEIKKRGTSS